MGLLLLEITPAVPSGLKAWTVNPCPLASAFALVMVVVLMLAAPTLMVTMGASATGVTSKVRVLGVIAN
ncbi:hypothetical protein D3C72_2567610 [compost metagenome]